VDASKTWGRVRFFLGSRVRFRFSGCGSCMDAKSRRVAKETRGMKTIASDSLSDNWKRRNTRAKVPATVGVGGLALEGRGSLLAGWPGSTPQARAGHETPRWTLFGISRITRSRGRLRHNKLLSGKYYPGCFVSG